MSLENLLGSISEKSQIRNIGEVSDYIFLALDHTFALNNSSLPFVIFSAVANAIMSAFVNDSTFEATVEKAEQDAQDQALDRFG